MVVGGGLGLGAGAATAQTVIQPLVTDRPDATESASLVPPGFVQIEMGGAYAEHRVGSVLTEQQLALWPGRVFSST